MIVKGTKTMHEKKKDKAADIWDIIEAPTMGDIAKEVCVIMQEKEMKTANFAEIPLLWGIAKKRLINARKKER